MKRQQWKKQHRWFGLLLTFFILMFSLSGIILNHRTQWAGVGLSRGLLPEAYRYRQWNNGLLQGSIRWQRAGHRPEVLLYGNGGLWRTDLQGKNITDFNRGLPEGADYRQIKGAVQLPNGALFAAGLYGLYRYDGHQWQTTGLQPGEDERLTDLTAQGDTLAVLSRSALYTALPPYTHFVRHELQTPDDYDGQVSLFRTVWMLHSGEMWGTPGRLFMDGIALLLAFLALSGVACWLLPYYIRRRTRLGRQPVHSRKGLGLLLKGHDHTGRYAFVILLWVALTGWCLRPPLLLLLTGQQVPALPGTALSSTNAWNDKLRMIRYDADKGDWLLSTSKGFYRLKTLDSIPERLTEAPTVSVMGLNVWRRDSCGRWLCGSFSGMTAWDRTTGEMTDWLTGRPAPKALGSPFGTSPISGYCADLDCPPFAVEYNRGTDALPMPDSLRNLPISLWNLCLEIHTGRIYTALDPLTLIFIPLIGLPILWCLWSGYRIRLRRKKGQ